MQICLDVHVMAAEYSSPACFLHELEGTEPVAGELVTLYHNPRCSKSRAGLALLEASRVPLQVIDYLKTPPDAAQLAAVIAKLGIPAHALMRKSEPIYAQKYAGRTLTDDEAIAAMVEDPILIERPIAVRGNRAVIGRPTEKLEQLLR